MKGAPPRAIQELAGHHSITVTNRYMHRAPGELHNAIALLDRARSSGQQVANRRETGAESDCKAVAKKMSARGIDLPRADDYLDHPRRETRTARDRPPRADLRISSIVRAAACGPAVGAVMNGRTGVDGHGGI